MAWARKTKIILVVVLVVGGVVGTFLFFSYLDGQRRPQISIVESSLELVDCGPGIEDQSVVVGFLLANTGEVRGAGRVDLLVDGVEVVSTSFNGLEPGEELGFSGLEITLTGCDAQNVSLTLGSSFRDCAFFCDLGF